MRLVVAHNSIVKSENMWNGKLVENLWVLYAVEEIFQSLDLDSIDFPLRFPQLFLKWKKTYSLWAPL